ncbi:hypothetical protein MSAR_24360 [Mycolicibacterium sarraceniae]|uniref:Uncharacterized protein n=1 Tax=Mycolicibacterium sarraceniae TaxID=1534348 RepID=A0A7I7SRU3_9MYCO|nr:hypothetical protein MSAR_24360 [Mycolicibacterium sarraceniae]
MPARRDHIPVPGEHCGEARSAADPARILLVPADAISVGHITTVDVRLRDARTAMLFAMLASEHRRQYVVDHFHFTGISGIPGTEFS